MPTIWLDKDGSRLSTGRDSLRMAASLGLLWLRHRVVPVQLPSAEVMDLPAAAPRQGVRRMRPDVALVSPYPQLGTRHGGSSGVASYTANLAHALAEHGLRAAVVAPVEPGQPAESDDGPVRVLRAFECGSLGSVPRALAAANATGAPVVHLQHELFLYGGPAAAAGLLTAMAARGQAAKVVTMHQVVDPAVVTADYTRLHRVAVPPGVARAGFAALQHALPRLADATVVHERPFTRLVPGARVVPHGVEPAQPVTPERRAAARRALGLADDRLVALCFGFLAPYKGLEVALDAAVLAGPEVRLVVAGGSTRGWPRRAMTTPSSCAAATTVTRGSPDSCPTSTVAAWFQAADVALFPYPEPHASSGAFALALAHGTPALLSPRLAEACGAGRASTCALDPADVADRLRALVGDQALRRRMRDESAALAADRSWPAVARAHAEIYEEVGRADGSARRRLRAA